LRAPDTIGHDGSGVALLDDTDARLVERLVARDERAFNALVRAYERRVFSVALRMLGNRAEAEDLAQEVFVQVFKAIGTFRGESKLSTWIYRIAINLAKNRGKYLRVRHTDAHDEIDAAD
jgi:RNA polymerase sigma-70 factor (ECF subfamily)